MWSFKNILHLKWSTSSCTLYIESSTLSHVFLDFRGDTSLLASTIVAFMLSYSFSPCFKQI